MNNQKVYSNCEGYVKQFLERRQFNYKVPIQPPNIQWIPFNKLPSICTLPLIALEYKEINITYNTINNKVLPCDLIITYKKDNYSELICIIDNELYNDFYISEKHKIYMKNEYIHLFKDLHYVL